MTFYSHNTREEYKIHFQFDCDSYNVVYFLTVLSVVFSIRVLARRLDLGLMNMGYAVVSFC